MRAKLAPEDVLVATNRIDPEDPIEVADRILRG